MAHDPDPVIEAEVLEIDGKVPPPPDPNARSSAALRREAGNEDERNGAHPWTNWQRWPGQVRTLHPLWWPVLIVVGTVLIGLLLTLGVCFVIIVGIFRFIRAILRALFG